MKSSENLLTTELLKALQENDKKTFNKILEQKIYKNLSYAPHCDYFIAEEFLDFLSLTNIDNSLEDILKLPIPFFILKDRILDDDSAEQLQKAQLIEKIILYIGKEKYSFSVNGKKHIAYISISLKDFTRIDDNILYKNPNFVLARAIFQDYPYELDVELRKKFIYKAIDHGADINYVLKNFYKDNIQDFAVIADYLLDHPKKTVSPQVLLDIVTTFSTIETSNEGYIKIDPKLSSIKESLIEKCKERGATFSNQLSIYHDEGHAFIKLECLDCIQGKEAKLYVGLYPVSDGICDRNNEDMNYLKMPIAVTGALRWHDYKAEGSSHRYNLMSEFGGNLFKGDFYFYDQDPRSFQDINNMPHVSYNISKEKADELFQRIKHLTNTCDKELEYQVFGSNCIDFVTDMHKRAGLPGNYMQDIYGIKYPQNIFGLYKVASDTHNYVRNSEISFQNINQEYNPNINDCLPALIAGTVAAATLFPFLRKGAEAVYNYFASDKVSKEEYEAMEVTKSTKYLESLDKYQKIFSKIYNDNYSKNLQIANDDYNSSINKYSSLRGEEAIEKVRLLADTQNELFSIAKDYEELFKLEKEFKGNQGKFFKDKIEILDQQIQSKILSLSEKDLSHTVTDSQDKAKIMALQTMLITQNHENSKAINKNIKTKDKVSYKIV